MSATVTKNVVQLGNSRALVLPKIICEQLQIDIGSGLNLTVRGQTLLVSKADARKSANSIDELFADYTGNYSPEELNWGTPVGDEAW